MSALLRFVSWLDGQLGRVSKPLEQETFADGYMAGYNTALSEAKEFLDEAMWDEGEGPQWEA